MIDHMERYKCDNFHDFYQNEHSWPLFGVLTHQGQETNVCVNEVGCHLLR